MKEKTRRALAYLLARMKEPSSYAGLGVVATMLKHSIPDSALAGFVVIGGAIAGAAALFLPDSP